MPDLLDHIVAQEKKLWRNRQDTGQYTFWTQVMIINLLKNLFLFDSDKKKIAFLIMLGVEFGKKDKNVTPKVRFKIEVYFLESLPVTSCVYF